MSKWQQVKLGDVSESCLGKMLDQHKNKGELQPYLANIDVRWGEFDLEQLGEMKFELHEQERYGLRYGDLVICEGGEPGRCAIWKDQIPNMKIQKALHRVRADLNVLDNRFLFYWFLLAGKTGELEQYFTGATIKHMPGQKLKEVKIPLPPLEIQRKIADVLSAYDDLIENNRKQIKLLEEAAQRLYKEWFIDLRFPGHEDTKIIDGIPEGWEKKKLGDIAYESGKSVKKEDRDNYECYLPIDCLPSKSLVYTMCNDVSLAESSLSSFDHGDIIFGSMRPYFHKVVIAYNKGLTRSTCFVINSFENSFWSFLVMTLFSTGTIEYATQISVGTTMPYVRWKDFQQMPLLIPTKSIAEKFNIEFMPISKKLIFLSKQINALQIARDRLLPKLISGELEVK